MLKMSYASRLNQINFFECSSNVSGNPIAKDTLRHPHKGSQLRLRSSPRHQWDCSKLVLHPWYWCLIKTSRSHRGHDFRQGNHPRSRWKLPYPQDQRTHQLQEVFEGKSAWQYATENRCLQFYSSCLRFRFGNGLTSSFTQTRASWVCLPWKCKPWRSVVVTKGFERGRDHENI